LNENVKTQKRRTVLTTYQSHVLVVSIELDVDLLVDAGFRQTPHGSFDELCWPFFLEF
jgi:hypothetical protein